MSIHISGYSFLVLVICLFITALPVNAASKWNKADFFVDGKHIPGVKFTVNDSYAGLLPISNDRVARDLFFWYWPLNNSPGSNDLVFWIPGGPGCSGLGSMMGSFGPFILPYNMNGSVPNKNSWTQLSNMVFVDMPVGTGLSVGKPDITNEEQMAVEFYGFLQNFYATFPELKGMPMYLSGGSYAGMFIPYLISHFAIQEKNGKNAAVGINYQGFSLIDPFIVSDTVDEEIASIDFAIKNQYEMGLNATFIQNVIKKAKEFKVWNFIKNNLVYPPRGKIFLPPEVWSENFTIWDDVLEAATDANPCFSFYDIRYKCPIPYDQLGFPPGQYDISVNNFVNNVTGFIEYIHGDPSVVWYSCSISNVFVGDPNGYTTGDFSPAPADVDVMQLALEFGPAKRNVLVHGEKDYILIADGSAIALQNTSWFGQQGFQNKPQQFHFAGKNIGTINNERGLLYARLENAGHNPHRKEPGAMLQMQRYMLGQVTAQQVQS